MQMRDTKCRAFRQFLFFYFIHLQSTACRNMYRNNTGGGNPVVHSGAAAERYVLLERCMSDMKEETDKTDSYIDNKDSKISPAPCSRRKASRCKKPSAEYIRNMAPADNPEAPPDKSARMENKKTTGTKTNNHKTARKPRS